MSVCENPTAPINLSIDKTTPCDSTCKFITNYSEINATFQNMNSYIKLTLDGDETIKMNDILYTVREIRIYNKALHRYSDQQADGEILIIHYNKAKVSDFVIISIPIINSPLPSMGTPLLEKIIRDVNSKAPMDSLSSGNSSGSTQVSNLFTFSKLDLSKFVPFAPYFLYEGIFSFLPELNGGCTNVSTILVFSKDNGAVFLADDVFEIFKQVINSPSVSSKTNSGIVYYNKNGPNHKEQDIYIDCQPVNQTTDKVYVPLDERTQEIQDLFKEIQKTADGPIFAGLIGIILTLGIFYVFDNFFKLFKKNN